MGLDGPPEHPVILGHKRVDAKTLDHGAHDECGIEPEHHHSLAGCID